MLFSTSIILTDITPFLPLWFLQKSQILATVQKSRLAAATDYEQPAEVIETESLRGTMS